MKANTFKEGRNFTILTPHHRVFTIPAISVMNPPMMSWMEIIVPKAL
jgi:hypothetical protein